MASAAAEPFVREGAKGRARVLQRSPLTVVVLVATLVILWAWGRGFSGPYHFDDFVTPLNDPASQSLAAWWDQLSLTLRPVTKFTYALEAEAGLDTGPAPRRAVSLVFHAISAALLFLLMVRFVPGAGPLGAAFLAALWLAHPVHADNVLMVSGRSAVLSGMFLLGALIAFDRSKSWLAALLFVAACLSRETALAGLLPFAALAAGRPGSGWRSTLRELAPPIVGAALVLLWILTTPRYFQLAEHSFLGRPFWPSLIAQVGAVPVGLALLCNPSALSIDYGLPLPTKFPEPLFLLGVAIYLLAFLAIAFLVQFARRPGTVGPLCAHRAFSPRLRGHAIGPGSWRAVAVGLAVWLAAVLPTQSVIPKLDPLTNRPLALALAGLLLATAPLLSWVAEQLGHRGEKPSPARQGSGGFFPRLRPAAVTLTLALLLAPILATANRAQLFQSAPALWGDAALKSKTNVRPHLQYVRLLLRDGRVAEARAALAAAQRMDPFSSEAARLSWLLSHTEASR